MKKYFFLMVVLLITITGCGKYKMEDAINDFKKSVDSSKSYKLNGVMEITSGDEMFTYNIEASYLKDDYYKVVLVNQTNNHEQIILKNMDGLYVITPSLNKSFKFDSVWPQNSSQSYLLQNLLTDIKNDNEVSFLEEENKYIIKSKVNYPNNDELTYQKIYFDKDMNILGVEVYSKDDIVKIKVTFKSVNLKAKLRKDDFLLEEYIDSNSEDNKTDEETNNKNTDSKNSDSKTNTNDNKNCVGEDCKTSNKCTDKDCEKTTSSLEDIIYPLYIPTNTHLKSSETVDNENTSRAILTFAGDKNFVLVEEASKIANEFEIIPVFGDPLMLDSSIGALSTNSISWHSNNISYYLVSSDLSSSEMVSVAKSLGNSKTVVSTK